MMDQSLPRLPINLPNYERVAETLRLTNPIALNVSFMVVNLLRGRRRDLDKKIHPEQAALFAPQIVMRLSEFGLKSEVILRDIIRHLCIFGNQEFPKGVPIGSNEDGYWWIQSIEDREIAKNHFMARARVNLMRAVAIDMMFDAIPLDRVSRQRYVEEHQLDLF